MLTRRSALVLPVLLGLLLAAPIHAGQAQDAELDILRNSIRADKKAFVAINLTLTDEEAAAFWPVYDEYQADLAKVNDRFVALIEDYTKRFASIDDGEATKLVEAYLAIERDRDAVRTRHLKPIAAALPGRKVMRFYQIENKIAALFRFEIAATIPVIEE